MSFPSFYLDQWENVSAYFAYSDQNQIFGWLFAFHNEHQIVFPRLLFLIDWNFFGAKNEFLIFWIFLNQGVFSILFYHFLNKSSFSRIVKITIALFCVIFLFSSTQLENLSWGFQVQFVNVFLFAFVSIYAFTQYLDKKRLSMLLVAILFATLASFSMSNGLFIWPLLLGVALVKKSWKDMAFLLLITVFFVTIFLKGNKPVENTLSHVTYSWENLINFLQFVLIYLGNPLGKFNFTATCCFSAISICYLGVHIVLYLRNKNIQTPVTATLLLSSLFVVGSAIATAFGRFQHGPWQATSERYTTPALLLICFLMILTVNQIQKRDLATFLRVIMFAWLLVLLPFSAYIVKRQSFYIFHYSNKHLDKQIALNAIQNNAFDPFYSSHLHPNMKGHITTLLRMKRSELFKDTHNFDVPSFPISMTEAQDTDPQITTSHMIKINSLTEGEDAWIFYGGLKTNESLKGTIIYLADSEMNWVGSGFITRNFEKVWPFTLFDRDNANLFFVGHLNGPEQENSYFLYMEKKGELILIGTLTPSQFFELNPPILYPMDECMGVVADYEIDYDGSHWSEGGVYTAAPVSERVFRNYGSWRGGDAETGSMMMTVRLDDGNNCLDLPYLSGPVVPNGSISLIDEVSGVLFDSVRLPASPDKWVILRFNIPEEFDLVNLRIKDGGSEWGQWIGVGEPFQHRLNNDIE